MATTRFSPPGQQEGLSRSGAHPWLPSVKHSLSPPSSIPTPRRILPSQSHAYLPLRPPTAALGRLSPGLSDPVMESPQLAKGAVSLQPLVSRLKAACSPSPLAPFDGSVRPRNLRPRPAVLGGWGAGLGTHKRRLQLRQPCNRGAAASAAGAGAPCEEDSLKGGALSRTRKLQRCVPGRRKGWNGFRTSG